MPAWGNHEWDTPADDLRNYKGRFAIPHAHGSPGAPSKRVLWRGLGLVRRRRRSFHLVSRAVHRTQPGRAGGARPTAIMAAAQADRKIKFIVTFGHRPAYSTGYHAGEETLASILDTFGDRYPEVRAELQRTLPRLRAVPTRSTTSCTSLGPGGGSDLEPPGAARTHAPHTARCTSSTSASRFHPKRSESRRSAAHRRRTTTLSAGPATSSTPSRSRPRR